MLDALYDDYIYARLSEDDLKTGNTVARQLRNCRGKSAATGGRIIGEFSDNDISALNGDYREQFERLMKAVLSPNKERKQRRIVLQHTSRLWRNRGERAAGIDRLGKAGLIIKPIDGPELDLRTAQGRMLAGILGETDTGESEVKAERIRDSALERAQEGRANGQVNYGWRRQYVYNAAGKVVSFNDVIDEAEAAIVQEIVASILSGESLRSVTARLNQRGVPAPRAGDNRKHRAADQDAAGTRWGKTSVKKIALRPANVGLRIFHRGRDDEELMPAAWPPLITWEQHEQVVALLGRPERRAAKVERPGAREHLLTWGLAECGRCGGQLRMRRGGNRLYGRKIPQLTCAERGCVARDMAAVDKLVSQVMVRLLSREDALLLLEGNSAAAAAAHQRARDLRARLKTAAGQYADGLLEADQLQVITSRLKPQIAEAEAEAEANRSSPFTQVAASAVGDQAQAKWDAFSVTQKRAVMRAFGVRVVIEPAPRGPGFKPEFVRVLPRGAAPS